MKTLKLRSAFTANLIVLLFFLLNVVTFNLMIFYMISAVLLLILPACSTRN